MKAGICSIIWKDRLRISEVVATAARVGAQGVEVWGQPPHTPDPVDLANAIRLREELDRYGLEAPQFGAYARAGEADFGSLLKRSLDVTHALGAKACRLWAGNADAEILDEAGWERVQVDLRTACNLAEEKGLLITLERHGHTVTNRLWGCVRLLEEVDHPALRINFQIKSTEPETIAEEIRVLGPHILNTHAINYDASSPGRTMSPLSRGVVDWRHLVQCLRAAGNDGYVEVEFVNRETNPLPLEELEEELAQDIAFLKSVFAALPTS